MHFNNGFVEKDKPTLLKDIPVEFAHKLLAITYHKSWTMGYLWLALNSKTAQMSFMLHCRSKLLMVSLKVILIATRNIGFQLILHLLFLNKHALKMLIFSFEPSAGWNIWIFISNQTPTLCFSSCSIEKSSNLEIRIYVWMWLVTNPNPFRVFVNMVIVSAVEIDFVVNWNYKA